MMKFQVKFCHHSELRLWRTGMLFSTKSKCHKSNVHISQMYRYCFYDLKVHFWWPNKCLFSYRQRWNILYHVVYNFKYLNHFECVSTQYFTINLMNLVENFDPLHDNNQNSSLERVPVMPKWERQLGQQQHSHKQERAAYTGGRRSCAGQYNPNNNNESRASESFIWRFWYQEIHFWSSIV